jgi:hypothetical protein
MGNKQVQRRVSARRAAAFLAALGALVMSSGVALMVAATPANAADPACTPAAAYTETINHPAETHVVHHDAVAAVPEKWYNFAPNERGQFDGTPNWPTDDNGVWEALPGHANGGPGDQFGTFQQGEGSGSWFHREPGTEGQAAYDETIVDKAAWVETIDHAAVTCNVVDAPKPQVESQVVVSPPKTKVHTKTKTHATTHAAAVTPTVVEAGLVSTSVQDLRGEQGLALMVAGMVMLVAAGGLGLRVRGAAARI